MTESEIQPETSEPAAPLVLLTGATGYIGSRLLRRLEERPVRLRCLVRTPTNLRPQVAEATEIVEGDVLDRRSLDRALASVTTAYYLVHLMASSADFECDDRTAAENFAAAAKTAGVKRIVYLGGLGEELIQEYARQCGLRRWLISVPILTPYLSSLWLSLVTPAKAEVGRHLIEGLRNPTIVRNQRALEVFSVRPMGIREAISKALRDDNEGEGS